MHLRSVTPLSTTLSPIPALFAGWGSVKYSSPSSLTSGVDLCLCAVSGQDEDGRDVIALLDEAPEAGSSSPMTARAECIFAKPKAMSHAAASQLPLLALTAAAALHAVGLPPGGASVGTRSPVPAHVLIAGSSGRLPALLVQVLASRGARVCVAAQDDARQLERLGADEIINHNEESFSTVLAGRRNRPLDAVLDTVGAENPSNLRQESGAAYVSLAPPGLLRLCEEGAGSAISSFLSRWGQPPSPAQSVWVADELACASMREMLALIEGGQLEPPPVANEGLELTQQYFEFVNWARDAETGGRWGFPGESMWDRTEAPTAAAPRRRAPPTRQRGLRGEEPTPSGGDPVDRMRERLMAEDWVDGDEEMPRET